MSNFKMPKCNYCEIGKNKFQPNRVKTTKKSLTKDQDTKNDHIIPVHMVSAYHYILGLQVGSTTQRASNIYLICSQADAFLFTMTVVIIASSTKWL